MTRQDQGQRIGFVVDDEPSPEQQVAFEWLANQTSFTGERLTIGEVATDVSTLDTVAALWWHQDSPIGELSAGTASALTERIADFRRAGGGLVLSHHALTAVDDLGIDDLAPDRIATETYDRGGGFLAKSIYRDHPLFDGIQPTRFYTAEAGETAGVRYEECLPVDGEVFAGNYVDGADVPHEMPMAVWQDEPGTVVGIGQHLRLGAQGTGRYENVRSKLLTNALTVATNPPTADHPPAAHLETAEEFRLTRTRLDADPNRPAYHFSPPANWLNDPNGLVYWDGQYHLFYNHNPAGPFHGTIHSIPNFKGHAVSDDLVTWTDRPIGLAPTPDSPDAYGTWTGCIVDDDGTPTFVYTGASDGDRHATAGTQRPCLAIGSDNLETWRKHPGNPVIAEPPAELDLVSNDWEEEFRDHCVWRSGGDWYQIIGAGIEGEGGTALLYRSDDLREWEYCNPILVGDREQTGRIWECPELLDLGEKHLLHVSSNSTVYYFLGEFDGRTFTPEQHGRLDYGDFYAPQTLVDDEGRRILLGWVTEQQSAQGLWDAGWGGMVSVPRVLSLRDGELQITPAPALERLREVHHGVRDRAVSPTEDGTGLDAFPAGDALELVAEIGPGDATEIGFVLRRSPDGTEQTRIGYRPGEGVVAVDRSQSSLRTDVVSTTQTVPAAATADGTVRLHVFLDRSAVEVFVNDRRCLTSRIYPTRRDSTGIDTYAAGGEGTLDLDVWSLSSIW